MVAERAGSAGTIYTMSRWLSLLAVPILACARGPEATDTLPQLKASIAREVESSEQNAENSALVERVSSQKHLHGLTRPEVQQQLGAGDPCSRHPLCAERGFDDDDWYYEIGREGTRYAVRYRPALIVGFSRFGKVERTFVLRAEQ